MKKFLRKLFGWVPIPRVWRRLDTEMTNELEVLQTIVKNIDNIARLKDAKLLDMYLEGQQANAWYSTLIAAITLAHDGRLVVQKDFWEAVQTNNPPFYLNRKINEDGDIVFELTTEKNDESE